MSKINELFNAVARALTGQNNAHITQQQDTIGSLLHAAREAKGLSIRDLERETRIRHTIIEALEADNFHELPEPVFVRGFLRTLARVLGVEQEHLLALYAKAHHDRGPVQYGRTESTYLRPSIRISWSSLFVMACAIITVLVLWFTWNQITAILSQASQTERLPSPSAVIVRVATSPTPLAPTPTVQPTPEPTPVPPPPPPKAIRLEVKVIQPNTWVRVTIDGERKLEQVLENGASFTWEGDTNVQVRTSNAAGLDISYNGTTQGALGPAGQVMTVTCTTQACTMQRN